MSNRFENSLPYVPLVRSLFFANTLDAQELDEPVKRFAQHLHTQGWAVIDSFGGVPERIKHSLTSHYDWELAAVGMARQ